MFRTEMRRLANMRAANRAANRRQNKKMGDYCAPGRGVTEIITPEEPIMCPEGCSMPQRDAVDRRSRHPEGSIMQFEGHIMGREGGIISNVPRGRVQ